MKRLLAVFLLLFFFVPAWSQDAEAIQKQAQEQKRTGKVFLNFQNADISLVVLAVGFSVVFEVLSFARLEYSSAYELTGDIIKLNNALVEGKTEGLEVEKKSLEDYPHFGR